MGEYITLGHMELVTSLSPTQRVYYMPHHGILKNSVAGSKIRVVFKASQQSSNGVSLNDLLHAGPKVQLDLWLVLTRWIFFPIAFVADIIKMFRQVLMDDQDADLQRIIWREHPDQELHEFRLLTVTYGTTSAPNLAIRVLLQLAETYSSKYPRAAQLLKSNQYVDDFIVGADSAEQATELKAELIALLKEADIALGKWAANDPSLSSDSTSHPPEEWTFYQEDYISTLGLTWSTSADCFFFKAKPMQELSKVSKRAVLSAISQLFDPLGWLGPIIITAKVLMQNLWITGINWDESSWRNFEKARADIESIKIPRWIGACHTSRLEVHGFSDASERAYAACLYLVVNNDETTSSLMLAKTRVAPVKTLNMPRLELCRAHLLARLIKEYIPSLQLTNIFISCWTDAQIVLR